MQVLNGGLHNAAPAQLQLLSCSQPGGIGSHAYWIDGPIGDVATQTSVNGSQVKLPPHEVGFGGNVVWHVLDTHCTSAGPLSAPSRDPSSARVDWVGQPHSGNCELQRRAASAKRCAS